MDEDYSFLSIEFIKNKIYKKQNLKLNKVIRFLLKNFIFFFLLTFVCNNTLLYISKKWKIKLFKNKKNKNKTILDKNNNIDYLKRLIKIGICTTGKKENRYIREFIQYYKNYGIDKIFLYDNNDINDETFDDIIKDYIDRGYVKILNWRGRKKTGYSLRSNCYTENKKKFNWLIFYDIDEYIYLKNYTNIKTFLNEKKFKKCLKINLNWVIHTDNNLIYYDNRTLHERFPELEPNAIKKKTNLHRYRYKFILRGKIQNFNKDYYYLISTKVKGCNGDGKESELLNTKFMKNCDFKYYYIDHYYFKSLEEFIEKINKGDNYFGDKLWFKMVRLNRFFRINKITKEKINFIEKHTGINLSKYKKKFI